MATPPPEPAQGASVGLCLVSPPPGRAGKGSTSSKGRHATSAIENSSPKTGSNRGNRRFDDLQSPLEISLGNHQGR